LKTAINNSGKALMKRFYNVVRVTVPMVLAMTALAPATAQAQTDSKFPEQAEALMRDYV
jgi:hypothetical protein